MVQAVVAESPTWMLVAAAPSHLATAGGRSLSRRSVLLAVARRGVPKLLEATVAPALIFYVTVTTIGAAAAMAAVLLWGYGAILRRVARDERVPAILALATLGLTVRTLVGLLSGSTFAYFLQPIATTVVLAGVFLGSVLIGRPVVARMADDFCPLAPDVADRPAVARLFAGLTLLWAGVHLLTAATTLGLLVSMPVARFVALKTGACLSITVAAVVITVLCALRTAHREQLRFADA